MVRTSHLTKSAWGNMRHTIGVAWANSFACVMLRRPRASWRLPMPPNVSLCSARSLRMAMTLFCTMLFPVAALAEASWRVYDVRDLIAVLPASDGPVKPTPPTGTIFSSDEPAPPPQLPQPDSLQKTVKELADRLAMDFMPMFPGVFGIEAEEAEHAQLREMLSQLRQLYQERYAVDISMYEVESASASNIGDEVPAGWGGSRQSLVVTRRSPTEVNVLTRHAFVVEVQPVVASGAVGYSPDVKHVEEGLRIRVVVGADKENAEGTTVAIAGRVRRIALERRSDPVDASETGLRVDLPTERERSVQSQLRIPFGSARVLTVVPGFDGEHAIAIAAAVRKLTD